MNPLRVGRVAGIDPALKATGLAMPDDTFATVAPPKSVDGYRRHRHVTQRVLERLHDASVELVILEDYAPHSLGINSTIVAAELQGILRTELTDQAIPFAVVPPSTLKKYAVGKGNAPKAVLYDAAREAIFAGRCARDAFDFENGLPETYDEADAYWLRRLGLAILADDPAGIVHLAKIKWPKELLA